MALKVLVLSLNKMFDVNETGHMANVLKIEANKSIADLATAIVQVTKAPDLLKRLLAIDDLEAQKRAQSIREGLGSLASALNKATALQEDSLVTDEVKWQTYVTFSPEDATPEQIHMWALRQEATAHDSTSASYVYTDADHAFLDSLGYCKPD